MKSSQVVHCCASTDFEVASSGVGQGAGASTGSASALRNSARAQLLNIQLMIGHQGA